MVVHVVRRVKCEHVRRVVSRTTMCLIDFLIGIQLLHFFGMIAVMLLKFREYCRNKRDMNVEPCRGVIVLTFVSFSVSDTDFVM